MQIVNSVMDDIKAIFELYDAAVAFQKTVFYKQWQGFDLSLIEKEIEEKRQYKIVDDDKIVCIFVITFNDDLIWRELGQGTAIYLHRIVTHPDFHGRGYVKNIVEWAINYGKENGKQFVRMDTWGDNQKLIDYYQNCGFKFLGLSHVIMDANLPKHYQGNQLSLFEIAV